ncbi:cytochrome P450 [Annulohypoxylon truncatum]|uniref:cytochrome P450 n=1 Tax=Annulohypoxylon truncatum TaxID=327061 RepID=UPI0020080467|nr:cytochrome P450 [Annulohypoxylon truncatum]KAI1207292.1 cytochrome P450 [Annulohypoxylon truncatum]
MINDLTHSKSTRSRAAMDLSFSLVPAVIIGVGLGVAYCTLLVAYRLLFHPLRQYPGPLIAKISGFYGAFYAFRTTLHLRTWQDHVRYGPIVRQGPNKLVFNSVQALHDIYQNDRITKSRAYLISQRAPGVYGLFNAVDRFLHQKKRRLVGKPLSDRSMRAFEPTMIGQIDIFLQQLVACCQRKDCDAIPVNMTQLSKHLTMDIMGYLAFGYPLDLQTEATNRAVLQSKASFLFNIGMQLPFLGALRVHMLGSLRSLIRGKRYLRTLERVIIERLAEGQHVKHDLLFMSDQPRVSENDQVWLEDVRSEAIWFLIAGSDTTSATLSALFFYLAKNPHCYKRLAREIRSTFHNDGEIHSGPKLATCAYLRACIDETLRMSPALPGTLWREKAAGAGDEPLVIDGCVIPEGTQLGVNTYALLHSEEYFPEPFSFKPERWLEGSGMSKTSRDAFAPFSLGARSCLGKSMAYLEVSLVMAKTLLCLDFSEAVGIPCGHDTSLTERELGKDTERVNEFQIYDAFAAVHCGPFLNFRPAQADAE